MSTLTVEANLECERCYKKIQKVLCKLKEKENIVYTLYDNKKNTIKIYGGFDPERLKRKLKCKAGEAIKGITVEDEKKDDKKKSSDDEKKPGDKKPDEEKKKPDDEKKKPDEKSGDKKKPPADDEKPEPSKVEEPKTKVDATPSSLTTVNLQFTQVCSICYPWPCSDPSHHWSAHPQWPCEGAVPPLPLPFPVHHQHPPAWAPATPKWGPCAGPSFCGGCGACHGGWPAMPPAAMCCPGPASCRGCKGCRIVQEGKFIYEEYPPSSACTVM